MGKYKDLIDKAKETKKQTTKKLDDQKTGKPENQINSFVESPAVLKFIQWILNLFFQKSLISSVKSSSF